MPVGVSEGVVPPGHDAGATVTVRVTVWPEFDGLGALLSVTVEGPLTV